MEVCHVVFSSPLCVLFRSNLYPDAKVQVLLWLTESYYWSYQSLLTRWCCKLMTREHPLIKGFRAAGKWGGADGWRRGGAWQEQFGQSSVWLSCSGGWRITVSEVGGGWLSSLSKEERRTHGCPQSKQTPALRSCMHLFLQRFFWTR